MNDASDRARLQGRRKQLKLLMVMMLIFMVLSPTLGAKMLAKGSELRGAGRYIFYIGSPTVFFALFVMYLIQLRRVDKEIREETEEP